MTSLSFQTALQKNEAKLSSFVEFENEMASYRALLLNKAQLTSYVLTVLEHSQIQNDVITCTDNAWLAQWEIIDTMF